MKGKDCFMDKRLITLYDEETKYKKKSKAKGLPRSKHKHVYQTVLLKSYHTYPDFKTGKTKVSFTELPTKVCSICGRVDYVDTDPSFYVKKELNDHLSYRIYSKELSEKALALPKYYIDDFLDKFAKEGDRVQDV